MPEISRFLGIVITMYFDDHDPPHFHVRYGEHRAELMENWTTLATGGNFKRIAPLV